jgi:hypothetical protein
MLQTTAETGVRWPSSPATPQLMPYDYPCSLVRAVLSWDRTLLQKGKRDEVSPLPC